MVASSYRARTGRRGQSLTGTLITLAVLGGLVLGAIVLQPGLIQGRHQGGSESAATSENREILEQLAAFISASAEVIAVHQRGRTPFVEIVLRMHNERDSDFISPGEVAVISHSRILQTVMFYSSAENSDNDDTLLTWSELADPSFCDRWRNDPSVRPRLLASGVSDLAVELVDQSSRQGMRSRSATGGPLGLASGRNARNLRNTVPGRMRLGLTFAVDSPDDDAEEVIATIEVFLRQ